MEVNRQNPHERIFLFSDYNILSEIKNNLLLSNLKNNQKSLFLK
jgi:hypothetical protein